MRAKKQKPWEHSTGPRTSEGKSKTAQNAYAHGFRSRDMEDINAFLRWQKDFMKSLKNKAIAETLSASRTPDSLSQAPADDP